MLGEAAPAATAPLARLLRGRPEVGRQAQQVAEHAPSRDVCPRPRPADDELLLEVALGCEANDVVGALERWQQRDSSRVGVEVVCSREANDVVGDLEGLGFRV